MSALGFIVLIIIIILCIGVLGNRELSRDEERAQQRRREYARFRSVFSHVMKDFSSHNEKETRK